MGQLVIEDNIPIKVRREWSEAGYYENRDLFPLLVERAEKHPELEAVIDVEARLTFAELVGRATSVAAALASHGVAPGEVVGVQLENGCRAAVVDAAVAALGCVCLPYPPSLRAQDVLSLLRRSGAVAVVASGKGDDETVPMMQTLLGELPDLRVVFVIDAHLPGTVSLAKVIDETSTTVWEGPPPDPNRVARIAVTSGTEAEPKMLAVSPNVLSALALGQAAVTAPRPGWRHLFLCPMGAPLGMYALWGTVVFNDGTLIVASEFAPPAVLSLIARDRATHITGVPTHYQMLVDCAEITATDVTSLENVVSAGAGASPALVRNIRSRLCRSFAQAYGASEGLATFCVPGDPPEKIETTVGRPIPAVCSIRVVGPDGKDVPSGDEGEIWGRGPFAPLGYVGGDQSAASNRTADGWVKSGDLGMLDEDGYLQIVGRIKDIIVRGGFNISARKVEDQLAEHPSIRAVACVGVPDDRLGEIVCACLELRAGAPAPSVQDLGRFLLARGVTKNHLPERVEVVEQLPLGPGGKVLKRVLRERMSVSTHA
jgi:non-ribosomal peptide synthetase component E (peptide arylation enzyme)